VPADKPRRLTIPAIGLDAFIQQVSTDQNHRIAVPDNINLAGWYTRSVPPGETGLSIIDGHVTGQYTPGVFYNLGKLRVGDVVAVEYGGNSATYSFRVKSLRAVPANEATDVLFTRDESIVNQLNLITCSAYNSGSGHYDDRTIVVTERI
jgi:LPXTG-site transpeptidase (sortase) family protein